MISTKNFVEFDDLELEYGHDRAVLMFDEYKKQAPEDVISPDFANQIIKMLPEGFAIFEKAQWGLESEDSDSCIYWCKHYYLKVPSIDARVFIEVGDSHYYVNLIDSDECTIFDGENLSSWSHISDVILDYVTRYKNSDFN